MIIRQATSPSGFKSGAAARLEAEFVAPINNAVSIADIGGINSHTTDHPRNPTHNIVSIPAAPRIARLGQGGRAVRSIHSREAKAVAIFASTA